MLMDQILSHFPQKNLRFVFAYGSGMFRQQGVADMSKNMLDFVFAVDDATSWHRENIVRNPSHYSHLRHISPKYIAKIQDGFGARIYYNTLIQMEGRRVKYGVINRSSLINDLLDWETLYVSGRLQKPVAILRRDSSDIGLARALITNLQSAVHTALLLLPEEFTEEALYMTIAGLSYTGDFRMSIGEDRNKVRNIVRPNIERFRRLYDNALMANEEHLQWNKTSGRLEQSTSPASQFHHLNLLPKWLMFALVNQCSIDGRHRDTEEVLRSLAHDGDCAEVVQRCLTGIVKYSTISQTFKGLLTAGPVKSMRYTSAKLWKMRASSS